MMGKRKIRRGNGRKSRKLEEKEKEGDKVK